MSAARDIAATARHALLSVMVLLSAAGCQTKRNITFDAENPAVSVTPHGVYFADEKIQPQELPEILEDLGVPKSRTIHIQLDGEVKDLREARFVMGMLGKAGYTRPVLVTKRHAESMATGKKKASSVKEPANKRPAAGAPVKIRYKRAGE